MKMLDNKQAYNGSVAIASALMSLMVRRDVTYNISSETQDNITIQSAAAGGEYFVVSVWNNMNNESEFSIEFQDYSKGGETIILIKTEEELEGLIASIRAE